MGSPVPVKIDKAVWETLLGATERTTDPSSKSRVFRLFMKRRTPRHVVRASEIASVTRTERGIIRWKEGGYPALSESERKGGNAFIRGDIDFRLDDAWWMGREQTDLRILIAKKEERILMSAWWARGGTGGTDSKSETNGEVLQVKLLLCG